MKKARSEQHSLLNAHIGARVRLRRITLGLSQRALAEALGIRFPQVQKYESGANRIAGDRFPDLVRVLKVPVSYFFEGIQQVGTGGGEQNETGCDDWMKTRESIEILQAYYALPDDHMRQCVRDLLKVLALTLADTVHTGSCRPAGIPDHAVRLPPLAHELVKARQIASDHRKLIAENRALARRTKAAMEEAITLMSGFSAVVPGKGVPGVGGAGESVGSDAMAGLRMPAPEGPPPKSFAAQLGVVGGSHA